MKDSAILEGKSIKSFMAILVLLQSSHFHYKIYSNALLIEDVVLGGNGKL